MAEEFEGRDLSKAVFWDVDLTGARFRDVDMTDVTISHARMVNVSVDALIDHVTINGVDVTQYVNERDPWYPLRAMLRPADPDGMRAAWTALEQAWAATLDRAKQLPEGRLHESVGGEWSLVETLRHLLFATDKWFSVPILGHGSFHPIGLPNTGSVDVDWPGLDRGADPAFDEVLAARAEQSEQLHHYLDRVTVSDFTRRVDVMENGTTPLGECLHVVFEEEFHHNRYARRDLAVLEGAPPPPRG